MNEDLSQPDPQDEDLSAAVNAAIARRHAGRYDLGPDVEIDPDVEASVNRIRRARAGI